MTGVADAVLGALFADMAAAGRKNFFHSIAKSLSRSGKDIVNIIACFVTMQPDGAARMDVTKDDFARLIPIQFCTHHTLTVVHDGASDF